LRRRALVLAVVPLLIAAAPAPPPAATRSCFLLHEIGVGQVRRDPSAICDLHLTPASTFKVPHALAALDAGVIAGPDEKMIYEGGGNGPESSRRAHTLATAMKNSVVWYFQKIAQRLGPEREASYLKEFNYGNMDASSGLTTFWLGGSLKISPDEQLAFMLKLFQGKLPVSLQAVEQVKAMLVQPAGTVVNSLGEHPFDAPWPAGVIVRAKTGSATDAGGKDVRWLIGHVKRGDHAYVFVSCVVGGEDLPGNAAIELAAKSLRSAKVL
jgi:beta-lactamase class D